MANSSISFSSVSVLLLCLSTAVKKYEIFKFCSVFKIFHVIYKADYQLPDFCVLVLLFFLLKVFHFENCTRTNAICRASNFLVSLSLSLSLSLFRHPSDETNCFIGTFSSLLGSRFETSSVPVAAIFSVIHSLFYRPHNCIPNFGANHLLLPVFFAWANSLHKYFPPLCPFMPLFCGRLVGSEAKKPSPIFRHYLPPALHRSMWFQS